MLSIEPLEAQLREDPSDLSSWSVYGDWLLEQGDRRGMIVRLEQQLARAGAAQRPELIARIESEKSELDAPFSMKKPPKGARLSFRGGFVVGLVLPLDDTTAPVLSRILGSRDARLLRSLTLSRISDPSDLDEEEEYEEPEEGKLLPEPTEAEKAMAVLALDLRAIRELSFAYSIIGPDAARALAEAKTVGPLVSLDLRYAWIGDAGIAALAASPLLARVRSLSLQRNGLTAEGARALAASPHLGQLRRLDLRYNEIGVEGARALAESPILDALEVLQIHRADVGGAEGTRALAESAHLPRDMKRFYGAL